MLETLNVACTHTSVERPVFDASAQPIIMTQSSLAVVSSYCLLNPLSREGRTSRKIDHISLDQQCAQRKLELCQDLHSRTFMTLL